MASSKLAQPPRPRSRALLHVIVNPFLSYDHEGRLSGVVRYDPQFGRRGEIHYIDGTLHSSIVVKRTEEKVIKGVQYHVPLRGEDNKFTEGAQNLRQHIAEHRLDGEKIPHTDYHVARIREGALLVVDEATHKIVFNRKGDPAFRSPAAQLAAAKEALLARWKTEYPDEEPPEWPDLTFPKPKPDDTGGKTGPAAPAAGPTTTSAAGPSPFHASPPPPAAPAAPAAAPSAVPSAPPHPGPKPTPALPAPAPAAPTATTEKGAVAPGGDR